MGDRTYFFLSQNGDGAGAYESVWTIVDRKVIPQLISNF